MTAVWLWQGRTEEKLGNKEEEEKEEDREWTDYENLFRLEILPTDLQRVGDSGGGGGWGRVVWGLGDSPASFRSQKKMSRMKISLGNLGYPNRRYQEVPPKKPQN